MKKITLLDGGFGSGLWKLSEENGTPKMASWIYNIHYPEYVKTIHRRMIEAGSQIIQANTFSANRFEIERLSDFTVSEIITKAVQLAKECTVGTDVRVSMNAGPLNQMLLRPGKKSRRGWVTTEECEEIYTEMLTAGIKAGADLIVLETFMDLEMIKIAARIGKGLGKEVIASMTFDESGRTPMGYDIDRIVAALSEIGVDAMGLNCSLGPDIAMPIIREFSEKTDIPLFFKPNGGMPKLLESGETIYESTPEQFAEQIAPALDFVSYVGGCCGTDENFIRELNHINSEKGQSERT